MNIRNRILFIMIVTIVILVVLGISCYKNISNVHKENVHYTDMLTLKKQYPHSTNSFTQGLFFYNNQMYESIRFIWEISSV